MWEHHCTYTVSRPQELLIHFNNETQSHTTKDKRQDASIGCQVSAKVQVPEKITIYFHSIHSQFQGSCKSLTIIQTMAVICKLAQQVLERQIPWGSSKNWLKGRWNESMLRRLICVFCLTTPTDPPLLLASNYPFLHALLAPPPLHSPPLTKRKSCILRKGDGDRIKHISIPCPPWITNS